MAENEAPEKQAEEQAPPAKGGSKTLMLIIVGVVLLLISVGLVVFVIFPKYQELSGTASETEEVAEQEPESKPTQIGQVFTLDNLTINPKGSMGRRFAVFEIVLEFDKPELSATLGTLKPIIMDRYLTYLRTKTVLDLSRPAEMDSIRSHLKQIVNELLNSEEITNLYFTRFVLE